MSEEVFCQDLNEKDAVRPGGPFMIQLLFKEPPAMPTKESMLKIMEKHVGPVEMFGNDETVCGFVALSHPYLSECLSRSTKQSWRQKWGILWNSAIT